MIFPLLTSLTIGQKIPEKKKGKRKFSQFKLQIRSKYEKSHPKRTILSQAKQIKRNRTPILRERTVKYH